MLNISTIDSPLCERQIAANSFSSSSKTANATKKDKENQFHCMGTLEYAKLYTTDIRYTRMSKGYF